MRGLTIGFELHWFFNKVALTIGARVGEVAAKVTARI